MNKTVNCTLTHEGYNAKDRNNPAGADLRVSDNFSMSGMSNLKIKCDDPTIKFRIRENHSGSTDCDAFDGHYFKRGDIVDPTDYDKLYISDPLKTTEGRVPFVGNFKVWFEKA